MSYENKSPEELAFALQELESRYQIATQEIAQWKESYQNANRRLIQGNADYQKLLEENTQLNKALELKLDAMPSGLSAGQSRALNAYKDALQRDNDPKFEAYIGELADGLIGYTKTVEAYIASSPTWEANKQMIENAARQLRYMATSFTSKANFVPMRMDLEAVKKVCCFSNGELPAPGHRRADARLQSKPGRDHDALPRGETPMNILAFLTWLIVILALCAALDYFNLWSWLFGAVIIGGLGCAMFGFIVEISKCFRR